VSAWAKYDIETDFDSALPPWWRSRARSRRSMTVILVPEPARSI